MHFVVIHNGFVVEDFDTLQLNEKILSFFKEGYLIAIADDNVRSGWGVDLETLTFIRPEPPKDWVYINQVNCFAPQDLELRKQMGFRTDI